MAAFYLERSHGSMTARQHALRTTCQGIAADCADWHGFLWAVMRGATYQSQSGPSGTLASHQVVRQPSQHPGRFVLHTAVKEQCHGRVTAIPYPDTGRALPKSSACPFRRLRVVMLAAVKAGPCLSCQPPGGWFARLYNHRTDISNAFANRTGMQHNQAI